MKCAPYQAINNGGVLRGYDVIQEAQLMLTTGSTRLAVSRGQQHGTILSPLRLFAKHVIGTYR